LAPAGVGRAFSAFRLHFDGASVESCIPRALHFCRMQHLCSRGTPCLEGVGL
jgi:hypothetical protein